MIGTKNPATERSEIVSEESRGKPSRGSAETENTIKNEDDEELRSELLQDVPELLQDFKEHLVRIKILPVLLMNYRWSREQEWNGARVSTVSILTSRKTEIVTSV